MVCAFFAQLRRKARYASGVSIYVPIHGRASARGLRGIDDQASRIDESSCFLVQIHCSTEE